MAKTAKALLLGIHCTEVGKKLAGEGDRNDLWDIERLDRSADKGDSMPKGGRG